MSAFHFLRPLWFLALPPLLLLIIWLVRRQLRSRSWQAVCDPELLPHLLLGRSVRRANWPLWLLVTGLLLAVLALAGPAWQRQQQPLFRQQSALVILFDLSTSMQADDLKPSRFLRARLKIEDLLRQRREGQTALIVFAADAFTVTPLTEDRHTIEALLKSLDPMIMPAQGSDPARAIERGQDLLRQAGLKSGRLLLVTDEDRPELSMDAAKALAQNGFDLAVLGVGSLAGAPVPLAKGGFLKDAQGNLVVPRLDPAGLRQLASAGRGSYRTISIDDSDLQTLLTGLDERRLDRQEPAGRSSAATGDLWREEGVWLLWPLVGLAALAFRRGWLLVLACLLVTPVPAEAFGWPDLWQTPDQQASSAFEQGDYRQAAQQFQDSRWKASALYRAGEFEAAARQLEDPETADDWYNQGNARARAGDLPAALEAYRQALQIEPGHADAQYNRQLVEEALRAQQQLQTQPSEQDEPSQKQDPSSGEQDKGSSDPKSFSEAPDNQAGGSSAQSGEEESAGLPQQADSDAYLAEGKDQQEQASQPAEPGQERRGEKPADQPIGEDAVAAELPKEGGETAEQRETQLLLQQIPDDPGGLLRRKFLYQYRQRNQQTESDRTW